MRILHGAAVIAACALGACTATTKTASDRLSDPEEVDVNNASALKAVTDIEATIPADSAVTVSYEHKPEYTQVPYLAVDLAVSTEQTVTVTGTFPGKTPTVFIIDADFKVVATSSSSVLQPDGSSTTTVTAPATGVSVVVHDPQWSLPMSFQVAAK